MVFKSLVGAMLTLSPLPSYSQSCPGSPPSPGSAVWFDFQVQVKAKFVGDTTKLPYPDASLNQRTWFPANEFLLVAFEVDTVGRADPRSLKVLTLPPSASSDSVRAALTRWQFTPARVGQCRVPQSVRTALRWR